MSLTVFQIAQAMDVPLLGFPEASLSAELDKGVLGSSPTDFACLTPTGVLYDVERPWIDLVDPLLHEICHAVTHRDELHDERGLMALQWALIRELDPDDRTTARNEFAMYALDGFDVGPGLDFLTEPAWSRCVSEAMYRGYLDHLGRPIWGVGIHPSHYEAI